MEDNTTNASPPFETWLSRVQTEKFILDNLRGPRQLCPTKLIKDATGWTAAALAVLLPETIRVTERHCCLRAPLDLDILDSLRKREGKPPVSIAWLVAELGARRSTTVKAVLRLEADGFVDVGLRRNVRYVSLVA